MPLPTGQCISLRPERRLRPGAPAAHYIVRLRRRRGNVYRRTARGDVFPAAGR
jgi:hypothetical protein